MKRFLLLFSALVATTLSGMAQRIEVGIFGGGSNYMGDLSEKIVTVKETKLAYGIMLRGNVHPRVSLRGNIYWGKVAGSDANATLRTRQLRNLSFRSNITEFAGVVEINFRDYFWGRGMKRFTPYGFFGINIFRFNPMARFEGEWIELQPLGTEGQGTTQYQNRRKYPLTVPAIPLGIGIKYRINKYLNFGAEFGVRKTFTDYLDDVSTTYIETEFLQAAYGRYSPALADRSGEVNSGYYVSTPGMARGNQSGQDWYIFTGISLTFNLLPPKGVKCPDNF